MVRRLSSLVAAGLTTSTTTNPSEPETFYMFYRVYYQIPDQHINYVLVEADDDDKATNHFFNHRKVQLSTARQRVHLDSPLATEKPLIRAACILFLDHPKTAD